MSSLSGKISKLLFRIPAEQTTFAQRGFHQSNRRASLHLEKIGRTFVHGYDKALTNADLGALTKALNSVGAEWRGFAFEGAAMALTLADNVFPWRTPGLPAFLAGPADAHAYMVHVGVGWGIARLIWLRRRFEASIDHLDSLLRWLAVDGYGFHEGYFNWPKYVTAQVIPKQLTGYSRRVFDQGLGRSIWFVDGADVNRIPVTIGKFAPSRQADLWSGVGLASAYAGGVDLSSIRTLQKAAGRYRAEMAQGAAFAAKARQRAGIKVEHTEVACRLVCGISAASAAIVTDEALSCLPGDGDEPAYEVWRSRIRNRFAAAFTITDRTHSAWPQIVLSGSQT
jgi:hypothetical protein